MADRVRVYEVGPRDGLQNETTAIPLATKVEFIRRLAASGIREGLIRVAVGLEDIEDIEADLARGLVTL